MFLVCHVKALHSGVETLKAPRRKKAEKKYFKAEFSKFCLLKQTAIEMDILNASISEGEGGDADFASKINHKYKNLLDSDSEDDIRKNSTLISEPRDKKMVTRYLSSSSDTEPEKFARGKDRRKNSNPKKKSLSVKTVRVSFAFI